MMKKASWSLIAISLSMMVIAGCGKNNPMAPASPAAQPGKIVFAMDAADNIASGAVTITKGDLTQTAPITITNHLGSLTFNDIQAGSWNINVHLYDNAGVEIYSGTGSAMVKKNQTEKVLIHVNHNTGSLDISVEVGFKWAITAMGTETYNRQGMVSKNGSIAGTEGRIFFERVTPIERFPYTGYYYEDFVLAQVNVAYGVTYDEVPTPQVSTTPDLQVTLATQRQDGFEAWVLVRHSWEELNGGPRQNESWAPGRPESVNFNWSVSGFATEQGSNTVTATISGYAEFPTGSSSDIPGRITLQPLNQGVISNIQLVLPVAGQSTYFPNSDDFDDSAEITTAEGGNSVDQNSISFVLHAYK